MLYLPFGCIKDAARAVKRICKEEFTKVEDTALTKLLGIPTLIVTMFALRNEGEHQVLHLWCAHREDVAICPRCGEISGNVYEEKHRCIRHLDIWGKKTFLHFLSRRFQCGKCESMFTEELPFVETCRRQTIAFEQYTYESCISSNRKRVAIREGLSQSTVRDIFNRFARSRVDRSGNTLTRVLGIDEISLKKRHKQYALVISDIERKCILAVIPSRDKESLEKWIDELTERQRRAICFASIDMWDPYRQAIRNKLPHVRVVADRFHVMKQLNERLTQTRRRIQQNADEETRGTLKGSRWLLVRNRSELSSEQEKHLGKILDLHPELRTLYLLKEEFARIFDKVNSREKAERFLSAWKLKVKYTVSKPLLKFLNTLQNWWEEILNYFVEGVTNGFVEGLNGAIRNIIRRAFGYRNFQNFRLRVFAEQGFLTNPR